MLSGRDDPSWVWDRLLTVTDYYDGPLQGIATYLGKPHLYEFDRIASTYESWFFLMPIDRELYDLSMENWLIWRRMVFKSGPARQEQIDQDRERAAELEQLIGARLEVDRAHAFRAIGELREALDQTGDGYNDPQSYQVHWTVGRD